MWLKAVLMPWQGQGLDMTSRPGLDLGVGSGPGKDTNRMFKAKVEGDHEAEAGAGHGAGIGPVADPCLLYTSPSPRD